MYVEPEACHVREAASIARFEIGVSIAKLDDQRFDSYKCHACAHNQKINEYRYWPCSKNYCTGNKNDDKLCNFYTVKKFLYVPFEEAVVSLYFVAKHIAHSIPLFRSC